MATGAETCYGPRPVGTHSTSDAARLAAVFTGLLLVASVPVALAADASGLRSQAASLRANDDSLEATGERRDPRALRPRGGAGEARSAVASIAHGKRSWTRDRAAARKQLEIARNAVQVSESRLAELVRALYEQPGQADPLAILLGAASLEEALTGLDSLSRAAGQNNRIIEQARASRKRLAALDARLAEREAELVQLGAAADLARPRARRRGRARKRFVAGLRHQQGLNAARIASIELRRGARRRGRRRSRRASLPSRRLWWIGRRCTVRGERRGR